MSIKASDGEAYAVTQAERPVVPSNDGFYVLDHEGRFVVFDAFCEAYFKTPARDVLGKTLLEAFPKLEGTLVHRVIREAYLTGVPQRVEGLPTALGKPSRLYASPTPFGLVLTFTDQARSHEALAESRRHEDRYQTLFGSLQEGFCVIELIEDAEGRTVDYRYLETNPAFARQTRMKDAIGRTAREVMTTIEPDRLAHYEEVARTGVSGRYENPVAALGNRWYEISAFRVGEASNRHVGILFRDISERRRAEQALREMNAVLEVRVAARTRELQEAIQEMEAFNYSVSHDLRSPLRNIAGMASILLEDAAPNLSEEHQDLLRRQVANVRRMNALMDELLRLARLSRAEVIRTDFDLSAQARLVADAERESYAQGATVEIQPGLRASADLTLIRALLQNLVGNALKFSPRGGTIRIFKEGNVYGVSDEGIGFDMAYASKVFLPFERLVKDADYPGSGIGLANVERIVRRHGGKVWIESAKGHGTTVRFTLGEPALRAAA